MNAAVSIAAWSASGPGFTPGAEFVPPMMRRRLSPLQKIFFSLARAVGADAGGDTVVFASRDGEDTLTRRLVADFHADGSVSPHRFSASVYNAAPGLWSVFTGNRSAYTATAAGEDSIECGLIEALTSPQPSVFVYAEETGGGYGAAARFAGAPGARRVEVSAASAGGAPLGFAAWAAFLAGETREVSGRWLRLRGVT